MSSSGYPACPSVDPDVHAATTEELDQLERDILEMINQHSRTISPSSVRGVTRLTNALTRLMRTRKEAGR